MRPVRTTVCDASASVSRDPIRQCRGAAGGERRRRAAGHGGLVQLVGERFLRPGAHDTPSADRCWPSRRVRGLARSDRLLLHARVGLPDDVTRAVPRQRTSCTPRRPRARRRDRRASTATLVSRAYAAGRPAPGLVVRRRPSETPTARWPSTRPQTTPASRASVATRPGGVQIDDLVLHGVEHPLDRVRTLVVMMNRPDREVRANWRGRVARGRRQALVSQKISAISSIFAIRLSATATSMSSLERRRRRAWWPR